MRRESATERAAEREREPERARERSRERVRENARNREREREKEGGGAKESESQQTSVCTTSFFYHTLFVLADIISWLPVTKSHLSYTHNGVRIALHHAWFVAIVNIFNLPF